MKPCIFISCGFFLGNKSDKEPLLFTGMNCIKVKIIIYGALDVLINLFISKYNQLPSLIFRIMIWTKRHSMGVKVKNLDSEGYRFRYFMRGKPGSQPSVLMLHGFSLNKDMWLNTIEVFPKGLHLICLDLPGHGGTTRLLGESYTAVAQAKRIHQFVQCAGLNHKPFHLVGMSMGGMVAGVYAALYPAHVSSLALLCPAGLKIPKQSELFLWLKKLVLLKDLAKSALVPVTKEQTENFMKLCLAQPNFLKMQLLKAYLEDRRPHKMFFALCFLDLTSTESKYSLHENMRKIKAPTQIIWGKEDKVFDSSGAEILADAIPNSQVHRLEKCGHFITLERPRISARLLLEFYNLVCDSAKQKKVA
ncbi:monoacylglycerol lipase ABHD6-like isoform X2 [Crotalus tigris]|uniref:monoacylglycerol lipase ABHD6-like isoform X2 n=1 Tax=Crotalus tigris TaxID=88082 RepID=UPI00192F13C1|nr:monoacylglycerol lipase ABHD6-like isoform X2 [Crotalus tigris]